MREILLKMLLRFTNSSSVLELVHLFAVGMIWEHGLYLILTVEDTKTTIFDAEINIAR